MKLHAGHLFSKEKKQIKHVEPWNSLQDYVQHEVRTDQSNNQGWKHQLAGIPGNNTSYTLGPEH